MLASVQLREIGFDDTDQLYPEHWMSGVVDQLDGWDHHDLYDA